MNKNNEILTAKQVAEYLHIHPLTVHRYAREGRIPAFKIGTDWRFHKKYIEKWIKQKVSSNSDNRKQNSSILEKV
jgi:excisionase family DNA binding protein